MVAMRTGLLRLGREQESEGTTANFSSDSCSQLPLVLQLMKMCNSLSIW
jgi:hypothetical protein